jgi:hypothetical protein
MPNHRDDATYLRHCAAKIEQFADALAGIPMTADEAKAELADVVAGVRQAAADALSAAEAAAARAELLARLAS